MKFWTCLITRIIRFSYSALGLYTYAVLCYCYCVVYPIIAVRISYFSSFWVGSDMGKLCHMKSSLVTVLCYVVLPFVRVLFETHDAHVQLPPSISVRHHVLLSSAAVQLTHVFLHPSYEHTLQDLPCSHPPNKMVDCARPCRLVCTDRSHTSLPYFSRVFFSPSFFRVFSPKFVLLSPNSTLVSSSFSPSCLFAS